MICPVKLWREYIGRNELKKGLSILQKPDVPDDWKEMVKTSGDLDKLIVSTPSLVRGWNAAAEKEQLACAGDIGAHSLRVSTINNAFTICSQDAILTEAGNWSSHEMLKVYMRNQLFNKDKPWYKYANMSAHKIDHLNQHILRDTFKEYEEDFLPENDDE